MYRYRTLSIDERAELVRQRQLLGYPAHSPPHPVRDRQHYFVTASCLNHEPHMQSGARRNDLLDQLYDAFLYAGIQLDAWVVLPNHYHVILQTEAFDSISTRSLATSIALPASCGIVHGIDHAFHRRYRRRSSQGCPCRRTRCLLRASVRLSAFGVEGRHRPKPRLAINPGSLRAVATQDLPIVMHAVDPYPHTRRCPQRTRVV